MGKFTTATIKRVIEPGFHGDGNGLYLNVTKTGSRSWIQRITIDGKRRDIGLGGFPTIGLSKAREMAEDNRRMIKEGRDPLAEKKRTEPTIPTFGEALRKVNDQNRSRLKSAKVCSSWLQRAEKYILPKIGDLPLDQINRRDVLEILDPIWEEKPETGRRVRQIIRSTFAWAQSWGYVEINPAGEIISAALPAMPKVQEHFRALPYDELADALTTIRNTDACIAAKLAIEFQILTAVRPGEVRGATWDEIDWDRRLWIIPASRMKQGAEHRVPLSSPAMDVLEAAKGLRETGSIHIFPSPVKAGKGLSDMTITKILRSTGLIDRMTAHGIRSSFRDWVAEETATPWAIAELALAHRVGTSVEQAYHRTDLLEKRRELMDAWAAFLNRDTAIIDCTNHFDMAVC